jgi:hypothetical protein
VHEKFNSGAGDCPVRTIEFEDDAQAYPDKVGLLWVGAEWINVAEARALRDWLDSVLPRERNTISENTGAPE